MNFEMEAIAPLAQPPAKKKAKSPQELLALAKHTAGVYNRDNENKRKRAQERIERQRNGKQLGHERRTRHGR